MNRVTENERSWKIKFFKKEQTRKSGPKSKALSTLLCPVYSNQETNKWPVTAQTRLQFSLQPGGKGGIKAVLHCGLPAGYNLLRLLLRTLYEILIKCAKMTADSAMTCPCQIIQFCLTMEKIFKIFLWSFIHLSSTPVQYITVKKKKTCGYLTLSWRFEEPSGETVYCIIIEHIITNCFL